MLCAEHGTNLADASPATGISKETAEELLEVIQGFYPSGVERLYGSDRYKTAYKTADALKKALNVEKFEAAIITTGKDRYETSVKVAATFFEEPRAVVIAYGKNFPDGLCGGPLATALNIPLILSSDSYTADAASYINAQNVTSGYVLGGTSVISEETVQTVFALEDKIE